MKKLSLLIALALFSTAPSWAIVYTVDRSFADVELTGTVEIAEGTHFIGSGSPSPFTAIDLILKVGGVSLPTLDTVNTSLISGTGFIIIEAGPSSLSFFAIGDGGNPADLVFENSFGDWYVIGSDGSPAFEAAYSGNFSPRIDEGLQFPLEWATVEEEGSPVPDAGNSALLLGVAMVGAVGLRRKLR